MGNESRQADGFKAAGRHVVLQFPAQGAVSHQVKSASGRGKKLPCTDKLEDALFRGEASGVQNVPARGVRYGDGFLPDEMGNNPDFFFRYSGLDEKFPLAAADGDVGGKAGPGASGVF